MLLTPAEMVVFVTHNVHHQNKVHTAVLVSVTTILVELRACLFCDNISVGSHLVQTYLSGCKVLPSDAGAIIHGHQDHRGRSGLGFHAKTG